MEFSPGVEAAARAAFQRAYLTPPSELPGTEHIAWLLSRFEIPPAGFDYREEMLRLLFLAKALELQLAEAPQQPPAGARPSREPIANESGLCMCGCGNAAPIAPRASTRDGWVKGQPLQYCVGHNLRSGCSDGDK